MEKQQMPKPHALLVAGTGECGGSEIPKNFRSMGLENGDSEWNSSCAFTVCVILSSMCQNPLQHTHTYAEGAYRKLFSSAIQESLIKYIYIELNSGELHIKR